MTNFSVEDDEIQEPEVVDFVGVVIGRNEAGKYDAYRVQIVDGELSLSDVQYGQNRLKKSAIRVATLDLVGISQAITRGEIEFVVDAELEDE